MLPLIRRRLTASERETLTSGNVFVWEEAENDGGLLRWTDGRRWSQSRMRGDYLFYEEKMETTPEEKEAKAALRAKRASDPASVPPSTNRRKDRPNRPNGLTKQTYSALVYLPGSSQPRKWHVVAYFAGDDYLRLPVIESYDYLRNIRVPEGVFVSSKANGLRTDRYSYAPDPRESFIAGDSSILPYVGQYPYPSSSSSETSRSVSASSSASYAGVPPPQSSAAITADGPRSRHQGVTLPSISALTAGPDDTQNAAVRLGHPAPSTNYQPLSAEDRRVLNSFRVVL